MSEPIEMTVPEMLAVHSCLADRLKALRTDDLGPRAAKEMTVGARYDVKFGGELAAWVSMPKPRSTSSVTDPDKLLAWAREHMPHHVQEADEVIVCDALIDHLREHAPQFLRMTERLDPQWVADALKGMKDRGYIADYNGEKITDVPGITAGTGTPSPRVELQPDAAAIIGKAWRNGSISIPSLLALPGGED